MSNSSFKLTDNIGVCTFCYHNCTKALIWFFILSLLLYCVHIISLIVLLAFQLVHLHLYLGCLPTFLRDKCLLFIHLLCISRGFLILHTFLNLMLGIFTPCQQCHHSNSGRTSRYYQSKATLNFFYYIFTEMIYLPFFR